MSGHDARRCQRCGGTERKALFHVEWQDIERSYWWYRERLCPVCFTGMAAIMEPERTGGLFLEKQGL